MKSDAERNESKTIRELRKKNERLSLEVRRLRKMLKQAESNISDYNEDYDDVEEVKMPPKKKPECPKCGSFEIRLFQIMDRDYYICEDCGKKGRFTNKFNK